jgi:Predicted nucleotide-binding protein containing TIR-like domain
MTRPRVIDQELVVHVFAPLDVPRATAAYAELRQIWLRCRQVLKMVNPVPGLDLPNYLPPSLIDCTGPESESALALQERPDAVYQAIVRRHHDVLVLSAVLSPTRRALDGLPDAAIPPSPGWTELDRRWSTVMGPLSGAMLGTVRIFQGKLADAPTTANPSLGQHLRPLLPATAETLGWWEHGVRSTDGFALWETGQGSDSRADRTMAVLASADRDAELSAWTWSRGDLHIPPLGRYLLHTAKARYEFRVWGARGGPDDVRVRLDEIVVDLQDVAESLRVGTPTATEWRAVLERIADLRSGELAADQVAGRLRRLRRTVEIAQSNMRTALPGETAIEPLNAGPLADDSRFVAWFLTRLDDDLFYVDNGVRLAGTLGETLARITRGPETSSPTDRSDRAPAAAADVATIDELAEAALPSTPNVRRRVFVVAGRDHQLRDRMHRFLRCLDLAPLEPDECIEMTGKAMPTVSEMVMAGIAHAQAAIVVLTPDDVVRPHPRMSDGVMSGTGAAELDALQVDAAVLVQLGIALAVYPDRVLAVYAGGVRALPYLAGLTAIRLDHTVECRKAIALRLQRAGCSVSWEGTDWIDTSPFGDLDAYTRTPSGD